MPMMLSPCFAFWIISVFTIFAAIWNEENYKKKEKGYGGC